MTVSIAKDSIDLGIVTTDAAALLKFYQNVLGFKFHSKGERPGTTTWRV